MIPSPPKMKTALQESLPMKQIPTDLVSAFFLACALAAVLAPQFFFVWKIMPETKGRSLEEIEKSWQD